MIVANVPIPRADRIANAWARQKELEFQHYVRGTIVLDLMWVLNSLVYFADRMPTNPLVRLKPLFEYFKTGKVTIDFVFVCICWVRRQAAKTHPDNDAERIDKELTYMGQCAELTQLARNHPIVAGRLLLTHHIAYLSIGTDVSIQTTRLQSFCHLYSALRDRQLLQPIPLFENIIQHYEPFFFTPSRAAAVGGSFEKVDKASTTEDEETWRNRRQHVHGFGAHTCRCVQSTSQVVRLLRHHEYHAELTSESFKMGTWKTRLETIAGVCRNELFETHTFSRDLLQLSNDLADLFVSLRDGLRRNTEFAPLFCERPRQLRLRDDDAEATVIESLLPLLDGMEVDGSFDVAVFMVNPTQQQDTMTSTDWKELVMRYCQRAGDIISAAFDPSKSSRIEKRYYTFPSTPNWVDLEYDDSSSAVAGFVEITAERVSATISTCSMLMEMMEDSPGPLTDDQIATFKKCVMGNSSLLSMMHPNRTADFFQLFHYVAAGRVRDRRLVEWMLQMGAVRLPSNYFENPPPVGQRYRKSRAPEWCNCSAVRCAAKAGLVDIVRMILEVNHLRDLNKVTNHTRESLAHIAVRNGDKKMYKLLESLNADMCHKDAQGKYVYDLSSDAKWKRETIEHVIWQRKNGLGGGGAARSRGRSTSDRALTDAERQMQELLINKKTRKSSPTSLAEDRISEFTQWIDTLKGSNATPSRERERAAIAAVAMVDSIRTSVQYFKQATNVDQFSLEVVLREAFDASCVLFLLSKFHRQLPASTRDLAQDTSPFGKLVQRAGPASDFGDFLSFAMRTASLFKSRDRLPQAHELLELVERRLLKHKPRDAAFRKTVTTYLDERRRIGFEPEAGTLTEAQRVFHWLAPSSADLTMLDQLGMFKWFRRLEPVGVMVQDAVNRMCDTMDRPRFSMMCAPASDSVVVAADTPQKLKQVAGIVVTAATRCGIRFRPHSEADNTNDLVVDGLQVQELTIAPPA